MAIDKIIKRTINIDAPVSIVWAVLTDPELVKEWLSAEKTTRVNTDWQVGSPFIYSGTWRHHKYEDKGTLLQLEPEKVLRYSHWSKFSRQPDNPENYTAIEFTLEPGEDATALTLTESNFPAEEMYRPTIFYWATALDRIKKLAEAAQQS
jgi:uncharacterized protein YndB with AHSA1/START domain